MNTGGGYQNEMEELSLKLLLGGDTVFGGGLLRPETKVKGQKPKRSGSAVGPTPGFSQG